MPTRSATTLLVLVLCCASRTRAQTAASPIQVATPETPADPESEGAKEWAFSAMVSGYQVPGDRLYPQPTVTADRGRLHLEARYNYEDIHSGSAWVGYNLGGGDKVAWELTPMIGGVFGDLTGLVPALRWTLRWWKLDVFSESEIVVDPTHTADTFFYDWSEVGFSPLSWLRLGAAIQHSLVFKTPLDIQRGLFVGVTVRFVTVTVYEFNAGWTTPTWVGAASVSL